MRNDNNNIDDDDDDDDDNSNNKNHNKYMSRFANRPGETIELLYAAAASCNETQQRAASRTVPHAAAEQNRPSHLLHQGKKEGKENTEIYP